MKKFALKIGLKYLLSRVNKYLKKAQQGGELGQVRQHLLKYSVWLRVISDVTGDTAKICEDIDVKLADGKLDKKEVAESIDAVEFLVIKLRNRLK